MYYYLMYILGRIRKKYMNQIPEDKNQYKKSRIAFTIDGATAAVIVTLVSGTFLSGYLQYIGVSTNMNGIISAIPPLVAMSQPLGAAFAQKYKKRKPLVTSGAILHRGLFTLMFFIPFFIENVTARVVTITLMFSLAHCIGSFISPAASNWLISLTPQRLRGKYFSIREFYTLILTSVLMLSSGYMLDKFVASNHHGTGFAMIGVIVGIMALFNFISLMQVMEPESAEQTTKGEGLGKTIKMVLTEKSFRPVLIMNIIYNVGINIGVPYHSIYLISTLKLSYTLISIVGFMSIIIKAITVRRWGRIADKTSWAHVCKLTIGIIGMMHLVNFFLVPSTGRWMYPLNGLISNFGWSAIGIAIFNVQYDYAPLKGRTMYIGVCAAVTGVLGFSAVFISSWIIGMAERHALTIFGHAVHGQQIAMLLSGTVLLLDCLYIHNVLEKSKKIINNKEGKPI